MTDIRERAARARDHRFPYVVSCALLCLALAVSGASAGTEANIGLYQDESGSSCSFANVTGMVTVYVVVKPGVGGTHAVRFAAPIPSCFDATFVTETTAPLVVAIGSSQTGISLAHGNCQTQPFSALAITYFSSGGTTPCCEFPIVPDPFTGEVEAVDCAFAPQPISTRVAHFNADASCPCGTSLALPIPTNPTPPDLAVDRPLNQTLAWEVSNSENVTFDVYFGTSASPPLVASNQVEQSYNPGPLAALTTYRWMIVAHRGLLQIPGAVWSFTTGGPGKPSNPSPADQAFAVPAGAQLSWSVTPAQNQPLTFDVYFGTGPSPPLVAANLGSPNFNPGLLVAATSYTWRVVARDLAGQQNAGPIWTFFTGDYVPSNPSPANLAFSVSTATQLSWSVTPSQSQPLKFDVYFGTGSSPPLVAANVTSQNFNPGPLATTTTYFWRIVAKDLGGQQNSGPTWRFTTDVSASLVPNNPDPADNSVASSSPTLKWSSSGTSFLILISVFPSMSPLMHLGSSSITQYAPGQLGAGRFYWQVYANNTPGPVWSFITTGGSMPVAFTHFDAKSSGDAVEIRWELASDEAMSGFTLYRRDGSSSQSHVVAEGAVTATSGSYLDTSVDAGMTYGYELIIRTVDGDEFRSPLAAVTLPALALTLHQNVPNPFNPQTTIRYDIPSSGRVQLSILDVNGKLVRRLVNEVQPAGSREVTWNGRDDAGNTVSSGVYFYVLDAGKQRLTKKLVLLK